MYTFIFSLFVRIQALALFCHLLRPLYSEHCLKYSRHLINTCWMTDWMKKWINGRQQRNFLKFLKVINSNQKAQLSLARAHVQKLMTSRTKESQDRNLRKKHNRGKKNNTVDFRSFICNNEQWSNKIILKLWLFTELN